MLVLKLLERGKGCARLLKCLISKIQNSQIMVDMVDKKERGGRERGKREKKEREDRERGKRETTEGEDRERRKREEKER